MTQPTHPPTAARSSGSADTTTGRTWPSTPLDAAQRAFDLLVCPPAPLAVDGRSFPGLPARLLPLDEVKRLLIDAATPRPVRDAVWRDLVRRSRRDGPAWVIGAVGVAMPGLRRMAGRLGKGWHGDSSDRDGELLAGFVARLATIDLGADRIVGKLIDAGARAVKAARDRQEQVDAVRVHATWSLPPQQPWDHPDWVLARAVAAAVIGPEEHLLIAATRLEEVGLAVVAAQLGVSVRTAATWRRKAETRLVEAIRAGDLDWIDMAAARHTSRRGAGVRPGDAVVADGRGRGPVGEPPEADRRGAARGVSARPTGVVPAHRRALRIGAVDGGPAGPPALLRH